MTGSDWLEETQTEKRLRRMQERKQEKGQLDIKYDDGNMTVGH